MSGLGPIVEPFGGEDRTFRVLVAELELIQAKCKAGPGEVAHRLAQAVATLQAHPRATILELSAIGLGPVHPEDVRAPIFHGLIGGGMAPNAAGQLVRTWVDQRGFLGLVENATLAWQLVVAGYSLPAEEAGEAGESTAGASPPAS